MTRYEFIKSIKKEDYNRLKATGLLKSCSDFYIGIYDEFLCQKEKGLPIMQCYTNTSLVCCTSEDNVIKIVWNLSKKICIE
jgi:hypothetical protein